VAPPAGVSYGWDPADEQGLEFIVQLSPERLAQFKQGDEIAGEMPPEAQNVVRIRIRSGTDVLPKQGMPTPLPNAPSPSVDESTGPRRDTAPPPNPHSLAPRTSSPTAGPQPPTGSQQPAAAAPTPSGSSESLNPAGPGIDVSARLREAAVGNPQVPTAPPDAAATAPAPPSHHSIYAPVPEAGRSPYFSSQQPAEQTPPTGGWQPAAAPRDAAAAAPTNASSGPALAPTLQNQQAGASGYGTWGSQATTPYGQGTVPLAPVVAPQTPSPDRYPAQPSPGFSPFASDDPQPGWSGTNPLPPSPSFVASLPSSAGSAYGGSGYKSEPPSLPAADSTGAVDEWPFRKVGFEAERRVKSKPTDFWESLSAAADESSEPYLREDSTNGDAQEKPWWGLTMAVFALFASLGGNLYLGWIAVDVYRRYLDLTSDEFDDREDEPADEEREIRRSVAHAARVR
jgi:hypothetical protein